MNVIGRINLPENKPMIRAYVHENGFKECYFSDINNAKDYLEEVLDKEVNKKAEHYDYLLAMIWGLEGEKIIDFFGYSDIKEWPGDPTANIGVMEKGIYTPRRGLTYEDSVIVFGREGEYRRTCASLDDFMSNPPDVGIELKEV